MRLFGSITELVKAVIRTAAGKEVRIESASQTGTSPITVTIPDVGDSADSFTMNNTAATLTLKTIDADQNTISNIDNADIKAAAAIDATKIADGSVTSTEFQYLNTVTSNIQTQLDGKQAAGTYLTRTSTDTGANRVQNKDLDDATINVVNTADTTKKIRFELGGAATATLMRLIASATGNRDVTLPDATTTLVGTGTTDTLSNKTLGVSNTVTLLDSNFTLADNLDPTKLVSFQLSGITTGQARVYTVPDASTTLLGNATSQTVTNKDIDGGTASNTSRLTVPKASTSTLAALTRKEATVAYDTTQAALVVDDGINLTPVGTQLNEIPLKNYLKAYAQANLAPGTLSTVAENGNIATTAGLFYADTTSGAAALTQSVDTSLRGTNNYLSALSGASTAGARFFQFPAFALEGSDLGKSVAISFEINSSLVANDWDVVVIRYNSSGTFQERLSVSGNASQSSVQASAQLPTSLVPFKATFNAGTTAGDLYALRFRRLANSAQIRLDTLSVGPQLLTVGNAMTDWQAYTPTSNLTTNATYLGFWRRVGDSIELINNVTFSGTNTQGTLLPTSANVLNGLGLTLDIAKLLTQSGADRATPVGVWQGLDSGVSAAFSGIVNYTGSGSFTLDYPTGTSTATTLNTNVPRPFTISNGDNISYRMILPIVGWSTNVLMADPSNVEYVFNTSTSNANDTTSFGYGAAGTALPSVSASAKLKRVRFTTPVQPTDIIRIEVNRNSGSDWFDITSLVYLNGLCPYQYQNTTDYGLGVSASFINNTDVDIAFGTYAAASGATYGAAGTAWSALAANYNWRVKKISAGSLNGFTNNLALVQTPAATHAYLNSALTATADTAVAVIFDVERFDLGNQYSTSTGRFTAAYNGYYQVSYGFRVDTGGTAPSVLTSSIQKNDAGTLVTVATNRQSSLAASKSFHMSDTTLVQLNVGETVRVVITSSTQSSTVDFGTGGQSFFSINYVGA